MKSISDLPKRLSVLTLLVMLLAMAVPVGAAPVELVRAPEVNVRTGFTNVPDNTGSVTFNETHVGIAPGKDFVVENLGRANLTIANVMVPNGFRVEYISNTTIVP
ncbi:MAG: hypothetical protein HY866_08170, partial [Chloroflexi bacterium]|nr:hypothetical protein [Chloroflexota bacterium]